MAFVLIGFMGAGKSTVAAQLAATLGGRVLDSDALLQQRLGHSIAHEFESRGEASFRASEEQLVCELLAAAGPRDAIALGGGSVLSESVRAALAEHLTLLLDVDPTVAWERVRSSPDGLERPLARDFEAFAALHADRLELYEGLADVSLLWASAASGDYPVFLARGLLQPGGEARLAEIWPLDRSRSRPFLVSDETVSALYAERLGDLAGTIALEPGEPHKTLASAERVWSELVGAGITRADHLVALGGGVVGDLAGFCAATYQRGVPIVHVPTTLVAMVDSAYGGKTGIDLSVAKNYVGAYHQPAAVLVDPDTLATLSSAELAAGWVEVLKTALIAGGTLWERVSQAPGAEVDERTIRDCIATKLAIVAADERDAGARQVLNLGHTIGHAIETVTGYTRYRHGEAVGLGLLAALRLSGAEDLRAQVRELLLARELPVVLDDALVDLEEIIAASTRDKKRVAANVPFVLLKAPGEVEYGCEVDAAHVRAAVAELTQ
ncbi:MAG: bifunctional shikimate kinase/3-dehydroquinate synthase [Solirubrobacteraceae bacterium]